MRGEKERVHVQSVCQESFLEVSHLWRMKALLIIRRLVVVAAGDQ